MKTRIITYLLLASCAVGYHAEAQAPIITPTPPVGTYIGIEDLWAFSIITPTNAGLTQCKVVIQVINEEGKQVLQSESSLFNLPTGTSQYNKFAMAALKPIQNQITTDAHYANMNSNGIFPSGSYKATYTVSGINAQGAIVNSASQELTFTVDLLFPPTLLSPFDNDTIQTYTPLFTWAPAFSGAQRILYDITVAEQQPGQSAEQAINANPAYFKAENLLNTSISYPYSARQLKPNQWYAWRITAKLGSVPASRSETWRFIIVEPKDDPCVPKPVDFYYQLLEKPTGNYALVKNGQLNFYFNENYQVLKDELIFNIYNVKNKVVASNKSIARSYQNGLNYYSIMLTQNDASLPKGYYTLEVITEKKQKISLRFELVNDIIPCVNE